MEDTVVNLASEPETFTLIGLFLRADIVVKAVMIILVIASLWSWAIIFEKWLALSSAKTKAKKFEEGFWSGRTDLVDARPGTAEGDALSRVYGAAAREWGDTRRTSQMTDGEKAAVLERANRGMKAGIERELSRTTRGLGVLATVGSASPFIGLFGTVWGIMNAFRAIAAQQETNLAVVAPGIAEALFATALGLVAAIPAVIFYNKLTADANVLGDQMDVFSEEVLVRLSRKLSEGGA